VISHRLWQRRFAARPDILGHRIRLNGTEFTIVGVTRPEFPGPNLGDVRDLYVPMMMQPLIRPPRAGYSGDQNPDLLKNPNNGWLFLAVRRTPGTTAPEAASELGAAAAIYLRERGLNIPPPRIALVTVATGDPSQRETLRRVATLLTLVVGAVLLIACANVANLLLSRAAARRREVGIRLALGASRARIVRQLLTESMLLSLLGGAAGVALAWLVLRAFVAAPPPPGAVPMVIDFGLDGRVLAFSLGLSLLTGLVFGVAPALQGSRPDLVAALKQEALLAGTRFRRVNLKSALVVAEVALSLLLLIAAGLFIRSLRAIQAIEPGYAVDQLVSTPLNVNLLRYTRAQGREFYRQVVERMASVPGVRAATVARVAVLTGGGRSMTVAVEGRLDSGNRSSSESRGLAAEGDTVLANVVGPDFFATLGIPLRRGRDFSTADTETSPLVAIVSESMAARFYPGQDPIGKRFATGFSRGNNPRGDWIEIIGVARDGKYASLSETVSAVVYLPLAQRHETGVVLYVRATGDLGAIATQMRREIQAIEPNLPVTDTQTMSETIADSLYAPRMGAILLSAFGGLALLLAALGIYGVLAFSIARRTREIGIRVALGASRRGVVGLVVREGLSLVAVGLGLGLVGGYFAAQALGAFLYGIEPHDLATFAAVPCVLLAVAGLACWLPARRAVRVDPLVALRTE
jgi:predicted permease